MNAVNSFIAHAVSLALVWECNSYQKFTRFVVRDVFVSLFSLKLEFSFKIKALLPFLSK